MKNSVKNPKNNKIPKNINNYILEQKLFEINISSFYSAINTYIGQKVLIRIFPRNVINKNLDEITYINNEIYLLKLINHKNILRLYEIIESKDFIFLIYEYFECDSLSNFIKNKKLNEKQILTILYKISTSMIYIHHMMRIAHLTINLDSILIDKDMNIKIINFRNSCMYTKDIDNHEFNNDMFIFNCPEIHANQKFNPELADIYSCGILVYFLYVGELPFNSNRRIINDELIMKGQYTLPEKTSKKMLKVITSLMEVDPNKRKKFREILNEDWFNDIANKNEEKKEERGLSIFREKYPIDENVMKICDEYKLNKKDLFHYLNDNVFNSATSLYKQIEKYLNNKGIKTVCDLYSEKFIGYLNNNTNHYDKEESKKIHEKYKKEVQKNKEKIKEKIANMQENHFEVYNGLKKQKAKYDSGDYKKIKKEDFARMSKRRKSQLYCQQIIQNINKKKEENNIKKVNNNDPTTFSPSKEINVGFQIKEKNDIIKKGGSQKVGFQMKEKDEKNKNDIIKKGESQKVGFQMKEKDEKNKNDMIKKGESQKMDEENKKDTRNKGILKNSKKIRERRKSSLIQETNILGSKGKVQRRSSVDKNIPNFEEFIINFYQEEEKKNKKEERKDNKPLKPLKSFKSKKSFKSNKNDEKENIKKEYKKLNSFKKVKDENENSNKEKKGKSIEFVNIEEKEKSNKKKKDEEIVRKLSENKEEQKITKLSENKEEQNEKLVRSKSIKKLKNIDNNKNDIKEIKKNKEENNYPIANTNQKIDNNNINKTPINKNNYNILKLNDDKENKNKNEKKENNKNIKIKEINEKKIEKNNGAEKKEKNLINNIQNIKIKDINENKKEKKKENSNNKKEEKEIKKKEILNKKEKQSDKNKENKENKEINSNIKKEKEPKTPKTINKTKKEIKETENKKEVTFKLTEKLNKKDEKKIKEKKKIEKEKPIEYQRENKKDKDKEKNNVNGISKNYNDLFLNMTSYKKKDNENNKNNENKTQSFLALKNIDLNEDLINYMKLQNAESITNLKPKKLRDKKVIIRKFHDENKNSNISPKKNKKKRINHNNNEDYEDVSLTKYKMYLNQLFSENNNDKNEYNNNMTFGNNINNKSRMKKSNININNTIDNKTDMYFMEKNNVKNKYNRKKDDKKIKIKIKNGKYINNALNTFSNSDENNLIIGNTDASDDDNNEKLKNEYWKRINYTYKGREKNHHKRIKSYNNNRSNSKNRNNANEIKNNLNSIFYRGDNKSAKIINNKAIKGKIFSKENQKENKYDQKIKKNKENSLSISNLWNKDNKKNNQINEFYKFSNNNSNRSDISYMSTYNLNLEQIKNRLKEKLISVTSGLHYDFLFYEGPINIKCISLNNYDNSINNIINFIKERGYKYNRMKDNIFKCIKGKKTMDIEIVKIKGNLLYYLIKK